jgi:hypothetical protein
MGAKAPQPCPGGPKPQPTPPAPPRKPPTGSGIIGQTGNKPGGSVYGSVKGPRPGLTERCIATHEVDATEVLGDLHINVTVKNMWRVKLAFILFSLAARILGSKVTVTNVVEDASQTTTEALS